jgi:hypothetical protein
MENKEQVKNILFILFLEVSNDASYERYYHNDQTTENSSKRKNTEKSFSISDVGSRLGISLYF